MATASDIMEGMEPTSAVPRFAVPRMDALESRAWLALVTTTQLLPAALEAQLLADAELTHFEFVLLGVLNRAPDHTMQMKPLAAATSSSLPRLSKVVSRLEARDLVERRPCPGDARATNVRLTRAGRRAILRAIPRHLEYVRENVLDLLDRDELEILATALDRLVRHLDAGADPTTARG